MPTRTILVSGAANGLGAAFLEAYQKEGSTEVIAIDKAEITAHDNVRSFAVDVTDEASIDYLAKELKGQPIDLVIHSAGIRGLVPHLENEQHGDVNACETLEAMGLRNPAPNLYH